MSYARVFAFTLLTLLTATVQAVPITRTFLFSATFPPGSPDLTVSGSFGVTFDPALTQDDLVPNSVSLSIEGFTYTVANTTVDHSIVGDFILFGGSLNTNNGVNTGTDDFFLNFADASAIPVFFNFTYTTSDTGASFQAIAGVVTVAPTGVPEPASLALLLVGLGAIGISRWRRKS